MGALLHDLRYSIRTLGMHPMFSAMAIVVLALGIGANTAAFSVVNAVLIQPLPYPGSQNLVAIYRVEKELSRGSASYPRYIDWRDRSRVFEDVGGFAPVNMALTGSGDPEQISVARVSASFFRVFETPARLGRWPMDAEDTPNAEPVVVLSERLWTRRFGADPSLVGRTLILDGISRTVIGVMPGGFAYPPQSEAWVPFALLVDQKQRGSNFVRVVGRLLPPWTVADAERDMNRLARELGDEHGSREQYTIAVLPLSDVIVGTSGRPVLILMVAVTMVLLIACVNIANLLLARVVERRRELAVRVALGATRARVFRQLLAESLLICGAGAGAGVLLAHWLVQFYVANAPPSFPRLSAISVDTTVLAFTATAAIVAWLLFGLVPALYAVPANTTNTLRESGRTTSSVGVRTAMRIFIVVEVAMAVVLLVSAGLMLKSLFRLQSEDSGLQAERVVVFDISLPAQYTRDGRVDGFYSSLLNDLASTPGVRAVGAISLLPLTSSGVTGRFRIVGRAVAPADEPVAEMRIVMPGYFEAAGIRLLAGRFLSDNDWAGARKVMLVNRTMAQKFFPGEDPVGRQILSGFDSADGSAREIVGVVSDVHTARLDVPPAPELYAPLAQVPWPSMTILVSTHSDMTSDSGPLVRQAVRRLDPALPISQFRSLKDVIRDSTGQARLSSMLVGLFSGLAGALAIIGIYGVTSYSVAQRSRELAIRAALGATPTSLARLVIGEGLVLAALGIGAGTLTALGVARLLTTVLYEVSAADPSVLAATTLGVAAASVLACALPAFRAMALNPITQLRTD